MSKFIQWLCVMFVFVLPTIIPAQIWVARYNGPGNFPDGALAIALDNAGNIYVTGTSYGSGTSEDYATVKYDSLGVEQWVARYNGPGNDEDQARAIAVDNAGNIYVTGSSYGSGTSREYATVKYDSLGVEQWVATYDGSVNFSDWANAIAVDAAGYIYVTGSSYGDYATVKYDALGVEQWVATYNGSGNDWDTANAIAVDAAGYIYVTGSSYGMGTEYDYATVKYDSLGVEQWVARYNGPGNMADGAGGIALDNAGNVYVTGYSVGSGTVSDYATVKYDAAGVEQWVVRYDGPGNDDDGASAIVLGSACTIYVTGTSYGSGTSRDYATVKYDSLGVEQWVARYNGPGNDWDRARAIAVDAAGYIYITGYSYGSGTSRDYATVKYDALGVEQWVARYDGPGNDWDEANAIAVDAAGNIYVTGYSYGSGTYEDYATIKYSSTGIREDIVTQVKNSHLHTTIFSGPLLLPEGKECKVFDIMGRVVESTKITRGVYFIEIDGKVVQKVVKVR
jgi:3-isopropylmalate dehydratase small subunit